LAVNHDARLKSMGPDPRVVQFEIGHLVTQK